MTELKHYNIAVILRRKPGITKNQMEAIMGKLKGYVRGFGPSWQINVWLFPYDNFTAEQMWPDDVRTLRKSVTGIEVRSAPVSDSIQALFTYIKAHDEIWCLGGMKSHVLGVSRVARIYSIAQDYPAVAPRFKWMSADVDSGLYVQKGKK